MQILPFFPKEFNNYYEPFVGGGAVFLELFSKGLLKNKKVILSDINKEIAEKLAKVCGAVAVSWYGMHTSKDHCYNSIKYLTDAGMNQINMHFMLSRETLPYIDELINDIKNDKRLAKLNAVVFLSLKQKGRGKSFKGCSINDFKEVVKKGENFSSVELERASFYACEDAYITLKLYEVLIKKLSSFLFDKDTNSIEPKKVVCEIQ